jgi:hypothetical protein
MFNTDFFYAAIQGFGEEVKCLNIIGGYMEFWCVSYTTGKVCVISTLPSESNSQHHSVFCRIFF